MQIVSQSASLSYSTIPVRSLLTAPPPPKQIAAPRIAGLLPAKVAAPQIEVIVQKPLSQEELLRQLGPIRSREAMNSEIAELALEALQFLSKPYPRSAQRSGKEREI